MDTSTPAGGSYRLKKIKFFGRPVSILLQNENGPCPLLAISNVLLLQKQISIHADYSEMGLNRLVEMVANRVLEANPPAQDEVIRANQAKQVDDVIGLLPTLQHGLDVNVRFDGVHGFEFTKELTAFDSLGIQLVHGWLLDTQDTKTAGVLGSLSYNQVVEKLVSYRAALEEVGRTSLTQPSPEDPQSLGAAARAGGGGDVQQAPEKTGATNGWSDTAHAPEYVMVSRLIAEPSPSADGGALDAVDGEMEVHVVTTDDDGAPAVAAAPQSHDVVLEGGEDALARSGAVEVPEETQAPQSPSSPSTDELMRTITEGHAIEEFMHATASQLTVFGLGQLHEQLREKQLCVFFRNNHFSTLFKHEGELFLLITDLGYLHQDKVVWEKLNEVSGDTEFFDSDFRASGPLSHTPPIESTLGLGLGPNGQVSVEELELQHAIRLSAKEAAKENGEDAAAASANGHDEDEDFLLALRLQREEQTREGEADAELRKHLEPFQTSSDATAEAPRRNSTPLSSDAEYVRHYYERATPPPPPQRLQEPVLYNADAKRPYTQQELEDMRKLEKMYMAQKQRNEGGRRQGSGDGSAMCCVQ